MSTKDYSSKQESRVAKELGWSVVRGSGAVACIPGDIISDDWLGECKTHVTSGHKIFFSADVWNKLKKEAMMKHRNPVLISDDGSQDIRSTWCMCFAHSISEQFSCQKYPNKVTKNITFDSTLLIKELVTDSYQTTLGDDIVLIIPLYKFKELI